MFAASLLALGLCFAARAGWASPADLIIHEWGTFTSLQDEEGRAVGGLNTDDEPVPAFVHNVAKGLLIPSTEAPPNFFQGAPRCHPDVTMRLETPVLYVHAPEGSHGTLRVRVDFRGGWLTQFYPQAEATAPGVDPATRAFGRLTEQTVGSLWWAGVSWPALNPAPETEEHVWLAPRKVEAATLQTADGGAEKYLFYRGVGHVEAPLQVVRGSGPERLEIRLNPASSLVAADFSQLWLADVRADGAVAFRTLPSGGVEGARPGVLTTAPAAFAESEYSPAGLEQLREALRGALTRAGLFADEAEALLETWKLSYFQAAGLRLFFLVPRAWTEATLPLQVEGATAVERVMVGRIEIITPAQRQLLQKMAEDSTPPQRMDLAAAFAAVPAAEQSQKWQALCAGKLSLADFGVTPPPAYQAYLSLGRFRNALVLEEAQRRPSAPLAQFIAAYGLAAYEPR